MGPVSHRAFAFCPLTVMLTSRTLFSFLDGPTWLDILVPSIL